MQVKGLFFALPLMLLVFWLYQSYLFPHRMEQSIQGIEFAVILTAIIIVCGFVSAVFILILSGVDIAETFSILKNANYSDRKI